MAKIIKLTQEIAAEIREKVMGQVDSALADGNKFRDGNITITYSLGVRDEKAKLNISPKAYLKMQALIASSPKEVGWHGTAYRDDEDENIYRIDDIMVYPQMVDGTNVNTDEQEYYVWNMSLDNETANNLRFHGHSHVNMGVFASSVDLQHQKEILGMMDDDMFYIFMIMNKRGEINTKIYDLKKNLLFESDDVTVGVAQDDLNIPEFLENSKKLVKDIPAPTYGVQYGNYGNYGCNNGYSNNQTGSAKNTSGNSNVKDVKTSAGNAKSGSKKDDTGKKKTTLDNGYVIPGKRGVYNASDILSDLSEDEDDENMYDGGWYPGSYYR